MKQKAIYCRVNCGRHRNIAEKLSKEVRKTVLDVLDGIKELIPNVIMGNVKIEDLSRIPNF